MLMLGRGGMPGARAANPCMYVYYCRTGGPKGLETFRARAGPGHESLTYGPWAARDSGRGIRDSGRGITRGGR